MAEGIDKTEMALEAKNKGNLFFKKKNMDGYEKALEAYSEAISYDATNHVFYANRAACYIEIGILEYEPHKEVDNFARALIEARKCTEINDQWVKGFVRRALAEYKVVAHAKKWEDRKISDAELDKKFAKDVEDTEEAKQVDDIPESLKETVAAATYKGCEDSCRAGLAIDPDHHELRSRLQALRDQGYVTNEEADKLMRKPEAAALKKADGNKHFKDKKFKAAIDAYTDALVQDPFDHVFYSNRSACYAEDESFDSALRDAQRCVQLSPSFAKGYSRMSFALFHLGRYPEAEKAAQDGLNVDATNAVLKDALVRAQVETKETPETQRVLHGFREEKRRDLKMQELLKGFNMQGSGMQMFNGMDGLKGLNGFNMGGGGQGGKSNMSDDQLRNMARAMGTVTENK